jgi:NADH-quinone oxidoreductase subunit A
MLFQLGSALAFVIVACVFLAVTLLIGKILRPATPDAAKGAVYECGEQPIGAGWFNFNPRFYIVALVFLIFDVEVAFTFPVATAFRRWVARGEAGIAFAEIAAFVAILALGLAYVWRKGDLEWVRPGEVDPAAGTGDLPAERG